MIKKELRAVSFSGGKDSTALLLRMLEEGMPIDIILFNETGLDFPEMEAHIEKVEQYIKRLFAVCSGFPESAFKATATLDRT